MLIQNHQLKRELQQVLEDPTLDQGHRKKALKKMRSLIAP